MPEGKKPVGMPSCRCEDFFKVA